MPSSCTWFPSQTFVPRRYSPGNVGNWSGHLPFANDLTLAVRPSLFVELGTHLGESYFGFCQAIAENGIPCLAYAIDNWKGEAHAGFYDETVYEEVLSYNEANYRSFSYLIRSLFDDALGSFADDSIDILHVDGLHFFDAVSHDFYAWLPKVKPGGIVLLHDVAVRHRDFGVWKLWETLRTQGRTFDFNHSWGLGVFQKPGGSESRSELLEAMFDGNERTREQIRRFYSLSASELKCKHALEASALASPSSEDIRLQVYSPLLNGYQESHSQTVTVKPNRWQQVSMELPEGIATGKLRLDLADRPAMIELRGITLRSAVDGALLWNASGPDIDLLTPGGTLIHIKPTENREESNGAGLFFSYGGDPQLYLPPLDPTKFDQPLRLEIWMRAQTTLDSLLPMLAKDKPVPQLLSDQHSQEINDLKGQLRTLQNERDLERGSLAQGIERERDAFAAEIQIAKNQLAADQLQRQRIVAELQAAKEQLAANQLEHERLMGEVTAELNAAKPQLATNQLEHERLMGEVTTELHAAKAQLATTQREHEKLIQEVNRKQTMIYLLEDLPETARQAENRIEELEEKSSNLQTALAELRNSHRALQEERQKLHATLSKVLVSHSWRLTSPLRKVSESLRGNHTSGN